MAGWRRDVTGSESSMAPKLLPSAMKGTLLRSRARERNRIVTSPYSSSLLKETTEGTSVPRPGTASSRTVVVAAPPAYHQPYPATVMVAPAAPARSSNLVMLIAVLLVTVIAGLAGYAIATYNAPTDQEMVQYQRLAAADGFYAGRAQGTQAGRAFGIDAAQQIAQYRALIARQKAWNNGYRQGKRTGLNSYRAPRRSTYRGGYYGGYRAPRIVPFARYGGSQGSLGLAQGIANATGSPVDVEVYN